MESHEGLYPEGTPSHITKCRKLPEEYVATNLRMRGLAVVVFIASSKFLRDGVSNHIPNWF